MVCKPTRQCRWNLKARLGLFIVVLIIYMQLDFDKHHESAAYKKDFLNVFRNSGNQRTFSHLLVEKDIKQSDNSTTTLKTNEVDSNIVIYNRVPKCGSSTLRFVIGTLKTKNSFNYKVHNWPNVKQSLTANEEVELVQQIISLRRPALFLRHLHHVDFRKYNLETIPTYFNLIRNPVDRFVSHFYFSRHGFQGWDENKIKKWLLPMSEDQRNMTIEDCVDRGVNKCITENKENIIAFFCGQDARCRTRDAWSVKQAMANIERDFAVVGILERLEDSLKIAEVILPRYFNGAVGILRSHPEGGKYTKTAGKKEPPERIRKLLEDGLRPEMELYFFVKRRFVKQYEILKKSGKIS